jgi:hypothetical protein
MNGPHAVKPNPTGSDIINIICFGLCETDKPKKPSANDAIPSNANNLGFILVIDFPTIAAHIAELNKKAIIPRLT